MLPPASVTAMPDLNNIQGLVVRPAPQPRSFVLLFTLQDIDAARGFIRWCLPRIALGGGATDAVDRPLQLGLNWAGLAKLAAPALDPVLGRAEFEEAFVHSTPDHVTIAPAAGFRGPSAPELWWQGRFTNTAIELVVHASFAPGDEAAGVAELRVAATAAGLRELTLPAFAEEALNGQRPTGGILHFGYRDGITHPNIDWADDKSHAVDCREILLGYPNADYPQSPFAPGPWLDLARDGFFACLAWIHQDVAAFNRMLAETALTLPLPAAIDRQEWLAARMMGRWRDGSPILRWPNAMPPVADLDDGFGFAQDPQGQLCPLNAHIRVVHPRDDPLAFAIRRKFPKGPPRLLRRGFTYGPTLEGIVDDGQERGIVGLFLCARINEQFYSVLRWMQTTTFAEGFDKGRHSAHMQDALIGQGSMPGADRRLLVGPEAQSAPVALRDLITFRGVTCVLMPSMTTLRQLGGS